MSIKSIQSVAIACLALLAVTAVLTGCAYAIAPHEVVLLVNTNSADSLNAARAYAGMRGIPESNSIYLDIPERLIRKGGEMTAAEFTGLIWEPVNRTLAARGLDEQILAWIYSLDFPLRVKGDPALSITGLTFLRNRPPDPDLVRHGRYVSPVYRGPDPVDGAIQPPAGFHYQREHLASGDMPLPSAMLGYSGPGGNTLQTVLRSLRQGAASDFSRPTGTVYFVTSPGIRSEVREWQFETAVKELTLYGVKSEIVRDLPAQDGEVLGLLVGLSNPKPEHIKGFKPGAFAEHLTSLSAVYDMPAQTKMTRWISAGASATAGVVVEPYAYWTKFPNARFFVYYAAGCAYIESFYQSVRCPLQIAPIGDPLMRPFGIPGRISFGGVPDGGRGLVFAGIEGARPGEYGEYEYRIDGRLIKKTISPFWLDLNEAGFAPGEYRLQVTARRRDRVRQSLWTQAVITVPEAKEKKEEAF